MSEPLSPDWVITGAPHGAGVRVIASKDMKPGGELKIVERADQTISTDRGNVATYRHDHWSITVMAENVVIVDASDYAAALRILMANWSVADASEPVRAALQRDFAGDLVRGVEEWPTNEDAIAEIHRTLAIIDELEAACAPMSVEERTLIEGVLGEEP